MARSKTPPGPEELREAGAALTAWYAGRSRDLPWRRDISPYRVLVSEFMLQQTRAEVVRARFDQFMARCPDVEALAAAPEEEVLKLWEGLGYYSRARNLHRAARMIAAAGGDVPSTREELLKLPGVGPYTAAAVLAIAWREPVAAVDANAVRIALRLTACAEQAGSARAHTAAEQCLAQMLPAQAPDVFTQAVMELGQVICCPRRAACADCPLARWCAGRKDPHRYPAPAGRKPRPAQSYTVAVLETAGRIALHRRPPGGLLAGLWEPLCWSGELSEEQVRQHLAQMGAAVGSSRPLEPWRHEFTHRIWDLRGWRFTADKEYPLEDVVWADGHALEQSYAVPSAFQPALTEWRARHGKTCGRTAVPLGISD